MVQGTFLFSRVSLVLAKYKLCIFNMDTKMRGKTQEKYWSLISTILSAMFVLQLFCARKGLAVASVDHHDGDDGGEAGVCLERTQLNEKGCKLAKSELYVTRHPLADLFTKSHDSQPLKRPSRKV